MKPTVRWLKPPPLSPGDVVRVVAPAGPFERDPFEAGLAVLSQRYRPVFREDLSSRHRYLAGSDARRAEELKEALLDPSAKAVFCARGGYGSQRLLPSLGTALAAPKLLVGFSDITALHLARQRQGGVSVHGPVLTQLGKQPLEVREHLFSLLETEAPPPPLKGSATYVPGRVQGPLLGGNLAVFTRFLGTPFLPDLEGAVLLLEDVTERPYQIDRMWNHLKLAGVFERVRGMVLGDFTLCEERDADYTSTEVLRGLAEETGLPCAAGFAVGHGSLNFSVALGTQVELDADRCELRFLEGAVQS